MTPSPTLPRVCILLADTGAGHRAAARSLAEALQGKADVTLLNLLDDHAPFPWNTAAATYGPWVNYTPWLWRLLYRCFSSRKRIEFSERLAYPFVCRHVAPPLLATEPDVVISVHPLQTTVPLRILRAAGRRTPFVTVVTDPVTPPVLWFCPQVDLCVVATEPARQVALAAGMQVDKLRVIGLPVRRAFGAAVERSKRDARASLGLCPEYPLVLLSGGGAGIGKLPTLARSVATYLGADGMPAQMAVICGRNESLRRRLDAVVWPIPVTVLGFVDEMADWLAAADVLLTKAGPGTLAEAACAGVPMIITGFVPGQEDGNASWVEQGGAGISEPDPSRAAAIVHQWLRPDNTALVEMTACARAIAQPAAAAQISQAALDLVARAPSM